MLATLRADWVNAWVLARDLDGIARDAADPDVERLCSALREHYDYPVDSVLFAPDLRVVGHRNVNAPDATDPAGYLAFLRRGLAEARGEPLPEPDEPEVHAPARKNPSVSLSREAPTATVLDLVRCRGFGQSSFQYVSIDVSALPEGTEVVITARVGGGDAAGKFELCAGEAASHGTAPVETLARVPPGESGTLTRTLRAGEALGVAVMPAAGGREGQASAYLLTVEARLPVF